MEKTDQDVYAIVTRKILNLLDQGIIPWRKPRHGSGIPCNLLTMRPYRGVNVLLLNMLGYKRNYFLSFNQVKTLGGSIKKDEKAQIVVFWKRIKKSENYDGDSPTKRTLLYYHVFNIDQCTGIPSRYIPPVVENNKDIVTICDEVIAGMPNKPKIQFEDNQGYYHPVGNYINMPDPEYFGKIEGYYATLFEELVRSTGHSKRLNRKGVSDLTDIDSDPYSTETLISELGSYYLQCFTGAAYDNLGGSPSYINGWVNKLKDDRRCIVYASNCAQKACDYILNIHPKESDSQAQIPHHETTAV